MRLKKGDPSILMAGIVISMFLWGISWPSGKILTRYVSAVNFSVYRYALVIVAMAIMLLFSRISFRIKKAGIPFFLASGAMLAVYSYCFYLGLKNGAPGAGGVLVTTMNPIMAYTIGIIISRKLPSRREFLGLCLGLIAGCVLLKVWEGNGTLLNGGNLYFLLASFMWAGLSKFTSRGAQFGSSLTFSLWQYVVTLLCLLPFADYHEMTIIVNIKDPIFWINLLFSSVIVTAVATTIYFFSTTRLGAEKASSFIFLVPLAAALSSWVLVGEALQMHTAIGGLLGMGAVYVINGRR